MNDETNPAFLCERVVDRIAWSIVSACTGIGCTMSDETRDAKDAAMTAWVWGARFTRGTEALDVRVDATWRHDYIHVEFTCLDALGKRVHGLNETNVAEYFATDVQS